MARVSFTLRRPSLAEGAPNDDRGSYLQFTEGYPYYVSGAGGSPGASPGASPGIVREDYDNALRADGLQFAPPTDLEENQFEAVSVCYGEVSLRWNVSLVPYAEIPNQPDPNAVYPTGTVLVYSPLGEPQTIASGEILVESENTFVFEHEGLEEGKWAYYSLFVHYRSTGGDSYFERAASLSVIVPRNYQSNLMLWNRIPEYYRSQDEMLGDTSWSPCLGNVVEGARIGPLFKFLSVIGFDIDRIRTLLDYQMASRDPAIANTETLDALSTELAAIVQSTDLGAQRLRAFMHDIGFYRRAKGTLAGVEFFVQSISGSDIQINTETGEVIIFSQRTNYIEAPKNGAGITTWRAAADDEDENPLPFSDSTWSMYDADFAPTSSVFVNPGTGTDDGVNSVLIRLSSPVPVRNNGDDRVMFSVQSGVGTEAIKWVRVVDKDNPDVTLGFSNASILVNGNRSFEVTATGASTGAGWTNTMVEYLVDLSEVASFSNTLLLAERNNHGEYFDGDTVRGGWLIDTLSVSDYRWSGSANNSPSIFAEDYERTKAIVAELLETALPINVVDFYHITVTNGIPGFVGV